MKQLIVLLSTVILGLSLSGIVINMGSGMKQTTTGVVGQIDNYISSSAIKNY